jgi:8-amino-7-oxononanoate synthase
MYDKELKAIQKSNRFRRRVLHDENLYDFASNDYLGLGAKKQLFKRAFDRVSMFQTHAPKASQMVNGYHPIHKDFEDFLCRQSGFEAAIVAGSGFLANLSLIEALPRRGDILILDEEYHASGILASKLVDAKVVFFKHNDVAALELILQENTYKRAIIAVEGIYSMSGDILEKQIFAIADKYEALLIVDEAHSSGVLGENLGGIFEHYGITIKENYIKMGTLGKAYGSYGAYILCSLHVRDFLQNRAKALIYATAPSLFDIELAHQGMLYIFKNKKKLYEQIKLRQKLVCEYFDKKIEGLIFNYEIQSSQAVLEAQEHLKKEGFLVGAIRPPTVKRPMLRIIPKLDMELEVTKTLFDLIKRLEH